MGEIRPKKCEGRELTKDQLEGLRQFMDYVQGHPGVWLCKRSDVAKHWMEHFPYEPGGGGSDA